MKINVLRRIEAVERRVKQGSEPPTLIMIHFDTVTEKWKVTEHYAAGSGKVTENYRTKVSVFDRLQDFFFPEPFRGRVILDTFASQDPAIYGNLFCFDIEDLREGLDGEIAIQSITEPEDEKSIAVTINAIARK